MRIAALAADKLTVKSGRKDHFDSSYPGLALRVSDTGRKLRLFLESRTAKCTSGV